MYFLHFTSPLFFWIMPLIYCLSAFVLTMPLSEYSAPTHNQLAPSLLHTSVEIFPSWKIFEISPFQLSHCLSHHCFYFFHNTSHYLVICFSIFLSLVECKLVRADTLSVLSIVSIKTSTEWINWWVLPVIIIAIVFTSIYHFFLFSRVLPEADR